MDTQRTPKSSVGAQRIASTQESRRPDTSRSDSSRDETSLQLTEGFFNFPNLLTIFRILLVPVFINLLIYGHFLSALGIFLLASFTDGLDGIIARAANQRTTLGTYLDPMADKLLLTAAFVALSVLQFIPVWVTVIVVSRDLILVLGALILHLAQAQFVIAPTFLGKATTFLQLVYIILVLSLVVVNQQTGLQQPLVLGMLALTVTSGLHYIYRGIRPLNSSTG